MKRIEATKLMAWDQLDMLTIHRVDSRGNKKPFYLRYVKKDGGIIEADNVLCTSVDKKHSSRRVKFLNTEDAKGNSDTRTLRDVLILQIDEYKIVKD